MTVKCNRLTNSDLGCISQSTIRHDLKTKDAVNSMGLDPAQQAAVESRAARILCLAGPGSGKTTVLTSRIKRLLAEGTNPSTIAVVTFTNAAAKELLTRLDGHALGYCGTLHGLALRICQQSCEAIGFGPRIGVIGEEQEKEMLQGSIEALKYKGSMQRVIASVAAGPSLSSSMASMDAAQLVARHFFYALSGNGTSMSQQPGRVQLIGMFADKATNIWLPSNLDDTTPLAMKRTPFTLLAAGSFLYAALCSAQYTNANLRGLPCFIYEVEVWSTPRYAWLTDRVGTSPTCANGHDHGGTDFLVSSGQAYTCTLDHDSALKSPLGAMNRAGEP
jgi:hypothetical protein